MEVPILMRPAVLTGANRKSPGMLALYPDRLVHVRSRIANWCAGAGFIIIAVLSFSLAHAGPGALGGALGAGGGVMTGNAIVRRQVPRKVAAGGQGVTVISVRSITRVSGDKTRWPRGPRLLISTSSGTEYVFRAKFSQWSADLADALAANGYSVQATQAGLSVLSQTGS